MIISTRYLMLTAIVFTVSSTILVARSPVHFPPPQIITRDRNEQKTPDTHQSKPPQKSEELRKDDSTRVPVYDPFMDNLLKTPSAQKPLGLFGKPIREVESVLRKQGARNTSYAFGRYSVMRFYYYNITLFFSRHGLVGGVSISPRPPLESIGPKARKFFMDLFLEGNSLEKFETIISSKKLEIKYAGSGL